jgi:hypothetical protein
MSLVKTYKEFILEQILLEYLYDGVIPTPDILEQDLKEYEEFHKDLSLPKSKYIDVIVDHGSSSSSEHINSIADAFSSDVSVITREIMKLAKDSSSYHERWLNELKRISSKANKLEQKINSLLLLANDSTGYFAYVGDILSDLSLVDTDLTTAYVNVEEQSCSIDPNRSSTSSSQINLNNLTDADISFTPVSRRSGTAYFNTGDKNSLSQIFKPGQSSWVGKISSVVNGDMTAEMKIKLTDIEVEVSKISIIYSGPDISSKSTITAQYSIDGYSWYLLPTSEATKTLTTNMSWHFNLIKIKWLKFIFYKPTADSGRYEYIYSIKNIRLFGNSYPAEEGNLFVTKSLSATDEQKNVHSFSSTKLDACEVIQDNTSISYSVSASRDNQTWTDWVRISPSSSSSILYPKIVSFTGLALKDNTLEAITNLIDSTSTLSDPQMRITTKFDDPEYVSYKFKDKSFGVLNTAIGFVSNPNIVSNSVSLWRNIRSKSSFPDLSKVRGIARGWGFEGKTYSCFFEIVNPQGKAFDFGKTTCLIDSTPITGTITIPKGIHKFQTSLDNWFDISDDLVVTSISSEEELIAADPLYPHNHKLIIEGLPYSNTFIGEKKYLGVDLSAEFYSTRISLFDLENNAKDYSSFAVRSIGNAEESVYAVSAFLKYDYSNPDSVNELSIVRWKSDDIGQELFKYIKLKAELITSNSYATPQLTAYRLELGN